MSVRSIDISSAFKAPLVTVGTDGIGASSTAAAAAAATLPPSTWGLSPTFSATLAPDPGSGNVAAAVLWPLLPGAVSGTPARRTCATALTRWMAGVFSARWAEKSAPRYEGQLPGTKSCNNFTTHQPFGCCAYLNPASLRSLALAYENQGTL